MKRVFTMQGIIYSENKVRIKGLMKTYGLTWAGSQFKPFWKSSNESITALFNRENGVTIHATLTYIGPGDTEFLDQFTKFLLHLGAEGHDEDYSEQKADIEKIIEAEIKTWDLIHKPNVDLMRRGTITAPKGAPESFIEAALKDYNEKRIIKKQEIREQVMKDYNLTEDKKIAENLTEDEKEQQSIEDVLKG